MLEKYSTQVCYLLKYLYLQPQPLYTFIALFYLEELDIVLIVTTKYKT